jgi:hypothetical protein
MPETALYQHGSLAMSQVHNNDNQKPQRPGDYPLGTVESRAAARAEWKRREHAVDESAVVVLVTGLPRMFGDQPLSVVPPDSLRRYKMPDSSIVEVIRRHWGGSNGGGVTIFVEQTLQDGGVYYGARLVKNLEEVYRTGCPMT